ncbi:phytoene/squalene synthase family protein [Sphingomonas sp. LB-2]|uniref:phytoene/squalene synthase family protein n=1 Tax=Sphingomonas caeni TaxID=2984949 RepID=UPI00223025BC|nr:phytoene/squalene synthase family protein [Sphingomonas caeni]MCW3846543.1 phytoene/squalene synthase family protein [Sphingomonas caeni]
MSTRPGRAAIVATAGESIARGSRSFAAASRLFDRRTRERAWLLYAWCRRADDIADGQDHGHGAHAVADPEARIEAIRLRTEAALAGEWIGDAGFDGLRIFLAETGAPEGLVRDVVAGFALDAQGWRPASEDDLYRYCYHVAGAVGCLMAVAMGVTDAAVLDRACDLGIGFQLANIARDIAEDEAAGRCYLPPEWLAEGRVAAAAKLAERAAAYAASGRGGTAALGFRSAWAVLAAAGIYGDIACKVTERGEAAWDKRVSTGIVGKLGWIARSLGPAWNRKRLYPQERPGNLWTRPR